MQKNKVLISGLALLAVGTLAYTGIKNVYADNTSQFSPMVERLVQKFNLNRDEVSKVVEEVHNERQTEMRTKIAEKLDAEVKAGNLTEDQKNKILAKIEEEQKTREPLRNLTPEERKAKMTEHRIEMQKWADDNAIDIKYIMGFGKGMGYGKGMGFGKGYGFGEHNNL